MWRCPCRRRWLFLSGFPKALPQSLRMILQLCRSGPLAAASGGGQSLSGGAALFTEGEQWLGGGQWLDGEQWSAAQATMAAAIVIRTINIAAQAATMVAESIAGARLSEGALLCEAELRYVDGARMLRLVDVVVDGDGKHN